jgi:hypothetical protein
VLRRFTRFFQPRAAALSGSNALSRGFIWLGRQDYSASYDASPFGLVPLRVTIRALRALRRTRQVLTYRPSYLTCPH